MKRAFQGFLLATLLVAAACYDWTVRASADADVDATTGSDAGADGEETSDGSEGDATALDAGTCAALTLELEQAYAEATKCTLGNATHCTTSIVDDCDCNRFVARPDAGATAEYVAALARFGAAGCKRKCPSSCPLQSSVCLINEAGITSCANN